MGLFDFFKKMAFFKGKSTEGLVEEDLDFQKWIAAHRKWRERLTAYVDGTSEEQLNSENICVDNKCDLGKWIYANGNKFYGDVDVFKKMKENHAHFHKCAGQIVECKCNNNESKATEILNGDFDKYSLLVVTDLAKMERLVKE